MPTAKARAQGEKGSAGTAQSCLCLLCCTSLSPGKVPSTRSFKVHCLPSHTGLVTVLLLPGAATSTVGATTGWWLHLLLLQPCHFSVQIDLPPTMNISRGLPGVYTAVQMHLHWGGLDLESSGSEHTIDGMRYFAEVRVARGCRAALGSPWERGTAPHRACREARGKAGQWQG